MRRIVVLAVLLLGLKESGGRADIIHLSNGDRYVGTVASVSGQEVLVQSEIVGTLKIPRSKVASIYFGTNLPPVEGMAPVAAGKGEPAGRGIALDPKAIEQVKGEFLATATPEANAIFTDMVQGLASGKLSIEDLRSQARDSLKELRELQAEIGEEENPMLSGYVGILERFVNQGAGKGAKAAVAKPQPAKPEPEEE